MQRLSWFSLAILLTVSLPARAQTGKAVSDWNAAGVVGAGRTWDDEGTIGDGLVSGARVARRLIGNTFVEGSIDRLHHERSDLFVAEGRTWFFTGTIVQRFGRAAAQPYVLGGVTIGRHRGTFGFVPNAKVTLTESTDAGFLYGGGLAVRAGRRFEVGPEIRFFVLGSDSDSSPAVGYWVGARFGVRF